MWKYLCLYARTWVNVPTHICNVCVWCVCPWGVGPGVLTHGLHYAACVRAIVTAHETPNCLSPHKTPSPSSLRCLSQTHVPGKNSILAVQGHTVYGGMSQGPTTIPCPDSACHLPRREPSLDGKVMEKGQETPAQVGRAIGHCMSEGACEC